MILCINNSIHAALFVIVLFSPYGWVWVCKCVHCAVSECARAEKWTSSLHTIFLMSVHNSLACFRRLMLIIRYTFGMVRRTNRSITPFGAFLLLLLLLLSFHWRQHSWTYRKCIHLNLVSKSKNKSNEEWTETRNSIWLYLWHVRLRSHCRLKWNTFNYVKLIQNLTRVVISLFVFFFFSFFLN